MWVKAYNVGSRWERFCHGLKALPWRPLPRRPRRPQRLGLLLPDPTGVASPVKATRLVGELADSVAYTHGLVEVAVERGWWSRRICSRLTLAECVEESSTDSIVKDSPELLEVMIDGSRPDYPPAPTAGTLLKYYVDSRKGSVLFLGARRQPLHA